MKCALEQQRLSTGVRIPLRRVVTPGAVGRSPRRGPLDLAFGELIDQGLGVDPGGMTIEEPKIHAAEMAGIGLPQVRIPEEGAVVRRIDVEAAVGCRRGANLPVNPSRAVPALQRTQVRVGGDADVVVLGRDSRVKDAP